MFLVTGSNGQLGYELKSCYEDTRVIFTTRAELDITDKIKLESFVKDNDIKVIINCAAYTNVEQAEKNIELCNQVNITAVSNLAEISKKYKILIFQLSTDYVFDGKHYMPYKETDKTNPLSVYGNSKLQSELQLLNNAYSTVILRASWLYSSYGKNFLNTILELVKNKSELNIIYDQIGTPTYAKDLALVIKNILDKILNQNNKLENYKEIYHFSNEGVASWYDFAFEISRLTNSNCKIKPIASKDYKALATRPHYSVLDKSKIKKEYGVDIRHWKDALCDCLKS